MLVSCKGGQLAFEGPKFGGHGAFFQAVIQGFEGKAANAHGNVTWDRLREYVKQEVADRVPKAMPGRTQTPEESGRLTGVPVLASGFPVPAPPNAGPAGPVAGEERSFPWATTRTRR